MSLINGLFKRLYWPICRVYARYLGDNSADTKLRLLCSLQFWRVYHFWPDFVNPKRFSEKLWSRMLHNRNQLFTEISDKLLVRDYISKKVGGEYLIPLLWSGDNPKEIPFDDLPSKFVIKTNHGCGYNIIVNDNKQLDREKTTLQLRKWLNNNFGQDTFLGIAWGYKNIIPTIIIESFIEQNSKAPVDYKFYCFSGCVEVLTVHFDRFNEHMTKAFDRNFEPYKFRSDFKQYEGECKKPPNFEAMVKFAESLSEEFDFMRVDLYSLENKIYFGELTPYPAGVSSFRGLDLMSLDYALGEKWKMK
ncbi:ATP-grasp fold amidoligase family protein [Desulfobacterium sp. N47]|uniref:Uncharacterized protein n=1 Tax=uncultured Desulfobacterium sp. TaxID=201089 RepID=E1YJL8_9BACT|nr:hypothetical protein N47_E49840 [uncultured Desulfobacterium sp.]